MMALKGEDRLAYQSLRELGHMRATIRQALVWLPHVPAFERAEKQLLVAMSKHMKPVSLQENDVLVKQGEVCDTMFFLRSGVLHVFVSGGDAMPPGEMIDELMPGAVVGEKDLVPSVCTVVAGERSELWTLSRRAVAMVVESFPDAARMLEEAAMGTRRSIPSL